MVGFVSNCFPMCLPTKPVQKPDNVVAWLVNGKHHDVNTGKERAARKEEIKVLSEEEEVQRVLSKL